MSNKIKLSQQTEGDLVVDEETRAIYQHNQSAQRPDDVVSLYLTVKICECAWYVCSMHINIMYASASYQTGVPVGMYACSCSSAMFVVSMLVSQPTGCQQSSSSTNISVVTCRSTLSQYYCTRTLATAVHRRTMSPVWQMRKKRFVESTTELR
jgi:hypothetical protein